MRYFAIVYMKISIKKMKMSIFMKCLYGANVTDNNVKIMEICDFFNFQPPYLRDKNMEI